ncbi:MAG: radical SAM protein, partial [Lachnospiraceae bacterium]|nr:radical SAM protein [Lachnospiraceae bacterium]
MKKISLYVHIPFCERKCLYCDFLSFYADESVRKDYVSALIRQIERSSEDYRDFKVVSIFFGGGTPSVLKGEQICAISDAIRDRFNVDNSAEFTIEVNPGTAYDPAAYKNAGINRISIGLQSADDNELKKLGRIHSLRDFEILYEQVLSNDFEN